MSNPEILGFLQHVDLDDHVLSALTDDLERAEPSVACVLTDRVREKYRVDLAAEYSGIELPHPFGKAAGQLSISVGQVSSDQSSGLAFTVLKSAVGVTPGGEVGIDAWERRAPKMVVERRISRDGRDGWTVTWKGRGWDKGFDKYVDFYRESIRRNPAYPVIASLMVDVTNPDRAREQATHCLGRLADVHWESAKPGIEFLVEIDISPTLSLLPGSDRPETFQNWVRTSVRAFRDGIAEGGRFVVKLPNPGLGPDFQAMLARITLEEGGKHLAGLVVANRLFDKDATFEGQKGVAYGGFDLSNINLETLDILASEGISPSLIGTGNICTGQMMAEYAVRGCLSGEIHTFFQLPPSAFRAKKGPGGRTWRALRELVFHPDDGLVSILLRLGKSGALPPSGRLIRFKDLPGAYPAIKGMR